MLKEFVLSDALAFYEITDPEYESVLRECLTEIRAEPARIQAFEAAAERLYNRDPELRGNIWSLSGGMELLFGMPMPDFTANLFILAGYDFHQKNMARLSPDEKQIGIQKFRVRQQLLMGRERLAPLGIVPILWSSKFICLEVVEIGRLQYELKPQAEKAPVCRVSLHIPPEGRLDREAVLSSLLEAGPCLKALHGRAPDEYFCTTWLLSNQLVPLMEPGSNLAFFHSLFEVTDSETDALPDLRTYLFGVSSETLIADFPEKTSLQRKVKGYLLRGGRAWKGAGLLRSEKLASLAGS